MNLRFSAEHCKWLVLLAGLFMLLPLPVMQYVGEEGLMALKSYEMHVRGDWLHPSILGSIWPHSPLWHWPVMAICSLIGWVHVDIAIRFVSVCATWLAAAAVGWASGWLLPGDKPGRGWLAALVYLTMGEISFWYGWLGYLDATFGFFIFAAIVTLWRALRDEKIGWLLLSLILISLAFMTKNITAYALFGISGLVLTWRLHRWHLLKSPLFVLLALIFLAVPWLWQELVIINGENTAITTWRDVLRNFNGYSLSTYLWHWFSFPEIFVFRALPVSLFLLWLWIVRRQRWQYDETLLNIALVLLACFLPFWISAGGSPRYLVPLYGLVALLLTGLLLQLDHQRIRQAVMLAGLVVLLKIPYSLAVLPYVKDQMPGRDVKAVAREVMQMTQDAPLYTENDVSTGLAIAAYIDVWRQDRPPVTFWNPKFAARAYVLAEVETPRLGRLVKSWPLRGDHVYLYFYLQEKKK
jgi:4-amino-4-deoxy-L-arabinose transferase-like glycosyltransferase